MTTLPVQWKTLGPEMMFLYRDGRCLGFINYHLGLGQWTAMVLDGDPRPAPSNFDRRGQAKAWLRSELGCEHRR